MPSIHDLPHTESTFRSLRVDPDRLRRLRNAFYKQARGVEGALAELPAPARKAAGERLEWHALTLETRHESELDGATKLALRTRSGDVIESVILRPLTGRTTLCVSSQVGCAARCAFCATGKMGVACDLTAAEILDQVIQANDLLRPEGRRVRNVVFMGMGEPFHNEAQLHAALEVLLSPACFDLTPRRVSVSTVGIPDAMLRCADRFPGVGIALSLHAARDEVRERIVPISKVHGLDEIRAALEELTRRGQKVMIEYLLLDALNDADEDLRALADWLRGLSVHVNLIPYNPIDGAPDIRGTPEPRRKAFSDALKREGYRVTLRYSLGADIAAACGQLARERGARR
jgi:23S rRNA (adenine2503-C2)-methyltransferase